MTDDHGTLVEKECRWNRILGEKHEGFVPKFLS
jgi:hypothetical protein